MPKVAANMGRHISVLALAARHVPMIVNAKTGPQRGAIISAHPLLFGAEAMNAATHLAKWRKYVKARLLPARAAVGCVRLLEDLNAFFTCLPKDGDWGCTRCPWWSVSAQV